MTEQTELTVEWVPVGDLHADPANVRKHGPKNLDAIKASLARFGQQKPIVVDADNVVRAGNGTLEAARALNWGRVAVVRTPLAGVEATAYAIADNRTAELAEWDETALAEQLRALQSEDFDLSAVGYDDAELDAMIEGLANGLLGGSAAEDEPPPIDKAEELLAKWKVKPGQLWEIPSKATPGKAHRLLCGDSTKAEDVAWLMGGAKADLCLTDPPYGIGEDYATHDDTKEGLDRIIAGFLPLARKTAPVVLLTPGTSNLFRYPAPTWTLAWACPAGTGVGAWGFCCWQPVLAYGKDPYLAAGMGSRPDFLNRTEGADNDLGHPCPKPIGVWAWMLERGSPEKGQTVYEPFAGSGTTLVAAEQTGRLCYGVEIAPKYCAVILERMANLGLEPVTASSGRSSD